MRVVAASEMARIEKVAINDGASGDAFMQKAAKGIADTLDYEIGKRQLKKKVTFFAGKGNNGGDAFCVALLLMSQGYELLGYSLENLDACSVLCQKYGQLYQERGGILTQIEDPQCIEIPSDGLILDGLLGTGFQGEPSSELLAIFDRINRAKIPIFSIDIPSGLNGNTGEVLKGAVEATDTLFLGAPKTGFFIQEGWNHVGHLHRVEFGLEPKYLDLAQVDFELIQEEDLLPLFPEIERNRHKYEAGFVVGWAGSKGMMGASILSGMAALKSGAGIVKVLHLEEEFTESDEDPELIHKTFNFQDLDEVVELMKKASAVYLGPGLGLFEASQDFLEKLLPLIEKPCILDADALTIIAKRKLSLPKGALLTPHLGEMHRLLDQKPETQKELFELCQSYVEAHSVTLVLKGGPTFIFREGANPLVNPTGDPGMATAGSGDVLTGILAGFLSQKGITPQSAAQIGVYLHGKVGEVVAEKKSSYGIVASDLIKFLYKVLPKKNF